MIGVASVKFNSKCLADTFIGANPKVRTRYSSGHLEFRPTDRKAGENLLPKGEKLVVLTRSVGAVPSATALLVLEGSAELLKTGTEYGVVALKHGWFRCITEKVEGQIEGATVKIGAHSEIAEPEKKTPGRKPKAEAVAPAQVEALLTSDDVAQVPVAEVQTEASPEPVPESQPEAQAQA